MRTKQVIVMRKDLGMRKGKIAAQAAHASMSFLTRHMMFSDDIPPMGEEPLREGVVYLGEESFFNEVKEWLATSFRKIVLYVNSEEELDAIHKKALDSGLVSHMVIDNGLTEFKGVLTKTCLCIGPHIDEKIDEVTNHLPLF